MTHRDLNLEINKGGLCGSCNRLNWGALDAWSSAPQISLVQLSCTLLPSLTTGLPH